MLRRLAEVRAMAGDKKGVVHSVSDGGVSGTHPVVEPPPLLVAPSSGKEFNTALVGLIPVGCWKVEDTRFAFNSSFVTPDLAKEIQALADLRKAHSAPDPAGSGTLFPPLSVFGHADPVGSDDYNKTLSGRRATAIYAVLISKAEPNAAVGLWKQIAAAESWGASQRQTMQIPEPQDNGFAVSDGKQDRSDQVALSAGHGRSGWLQETILVGWRDTPEPA